ncbi:MAG: hypothetical protein ACLQMO_02190 [Acidobacteriaceae bacterium]
MVGFFQGQAVAKERLYAEVAQAPNRYLSKARRLTERMWSSCGQFVDSDAPERAREVDFYSVWWELYLAFALSGGGISLVARKDRPPNAGNGLPDLLANNPRVWIEAVMPQPGMGADALIEPPVVGVFDVPADKFVLRLATALRDKFAKVSRYIESGTIPASDATIIAVSGGRLPFRFQEYPIPNIVRALCGVGFLSMELDVQSRQRLETYVKFRDHIDKKSKSPVSTDLFLQNESAHISAVLYSNADCVNYPRMPGTEFILVHNPNASVPLPSTWLPLGEQYRIRDGALRRGVAQAQTIWKCPQAY